MYPLLPKWPIVVNVAGVLTYLVVSIVMFVQGEVIAGAIWVAGVLVWSATTVLQLRMYRRHRSHSTYSFTVTFGGSAVVRAAKAAAALVPEPEDRVYPYLKRIIIND